MPKNEKIAWDRLYIQLIVLLLAVVFLIVGAAYFVPSVADNTAGSAVLTFNIQNQPKNIAIQCNDGVDNDNNNLVDLDDSKCKSRWDVSEIY